MTPKTRAIPSSSLKVGADCVAEPRMEAGFQCAGCGEWNHTQVDASAGRRQSYVVDCQVCCRANVLSVSYDIEAEEFVISATLERNNGIPTDRTTTPHSAKDLSA